MKKVVINECHGGFSLSDEACEWLLANRGWSATTYTDAGNYDNPYADFAVAKDSSFGSKYYPVRRSYQDADFRCDPVVVEIVEILGEKANGQFAKLKIVEIPEDVEFEIQEYDGLEHVAEKHRTWL